MEDLGREVQSTSKVSALSILR